MLFINRVKPQKPGRLMRHQRWVILVSFILAAVITPTPDPMNQLILAAPIVLMYQFSVGLIWATNRRLKKKRSLSEPNQAVYVVPIINTAPVNYPSPSQAVVLAAPVVLKPQALYEPRNTPTVRPRMTFMDIIPAA
jgi:hypothetical protein